jgi:hypothetical protein
MLKVSRLHIHCSRRPCPATPPAAFELGLSELDAGFWSRAGLAMPDLRADAMALLEIREPTRRAYSPPTPQAQDQRKLLGLLSQHVTRHGCPSRLVPPVPQEQRVLQLGIVADPSTLCIALAACVGELFDLSSGLRLQPRAQCR